MTTPTNKPSAADPALAATSSPAAFDARRFKAMERAGFNRIAARYAEGAHLRAELATALLDGRELPVEIIDQTAHGRRIGLEFGRTCIYF